MENICPADTKGLSRAAKSLERNSREVSINRRTSSLPLNFLSLRSKHRSSSSSSNTTVENAEIVAQFGLPHVAAYSYRLKREERIYPICSLRIIREMRIANCSEFAEIYREVQYKID